LRDEFGSRICLYVYVSSRAAYKQKMNIRKCIDKYLLLLKFCNTTSSLALQILLNCQLTLYCNLSPDYDGYIRMLGI